MVSEELQRALEIETLGFACPACNAKIGVSCSPSIGKARAPHPERVELAVAMTVRYFEAEDSEEGVACALTAEPPPEPATEVSNPPDPPDPPAEPLTEQPPAAPVAPASDCTCDHKYAHQCQHSKWGPPAVVQHPGPCRCLCHRLSAGPV